MYYLRMRKKNAKMIKLAGKKKKILSLGQLLFDIEYDLCI
jgi:hypothetical protein